MAEMSNYPLTLLVCKFNFILCEALDVQVDILNFNLNPDVINWTLIKINISLILQVCSMVSKYIMANKERLFDLRNVKIVMVKNDLLGTAFKLDYFHRSQVT